MHFWSNSRRAWLERVSWLTLGLAVGGLWWIHAKLTLAQIVVLVCFLLAGASILLRQGWIRFIGPMLIYDMIRVARRPRYIATRTLYALLLALLLCWFYAIFSSEQASSANRGAVFAESFFRIFMFVQICAVCFLTPAYTAGTIAEEKDRRTLEFVLATDLHNREIVFSKLFSRLANLLLIVLTGLPILGFLQFMGGVDPNLVLLGYAATALTILGLASLSIFNSTLHRRARDAITSTYFLAFGYIILGLSTYLITFPTLGWAGQPIFPSLFPQYTFADLVADVNSGNPIELAIKVIEALSRDVPVLDFLLPVLGRYALFHGMLTVFCITFAILRLRAIALKEGVVRNPSPTRGQRWHPRIGDLPMVWKELHIESRVRHKAPAIILILLLVGASLAPIWYYDLFDRALWSKTSDNGINIYVRIVGTIVACLMLLSVATRSASSISSERDRQTLDGLLTTPLTSEDILFGKWFGNICGPRWVWLWLGSIYALGIIGNGLHPTALFLLVLAWWVYASAVALIGMWFSITCTTTLRATVWTFGTIFFVGLGHWLFWLCCGLPFLGMFRPAFDPFVTVMRDFLVGLTPPIAIGYCLSYNAADSQNEAAGYAMLGLFIWSAVSAALWVAVNHRFRIATGRTGPRRSEPDSPVPVLLELADDPKP